MPPNTFLHNHPNFQDLIRIVAEKQAVLPGLIEKDYWIMHCLYGLQRMRYTFELKGGTSLSKGFGIIHRFSEDIDIRIEPPPNGNVATNPKHTKPQHCDSRKKFYDALAEDTKINGIVSVERDTSFDDEQYYRSGGIRLRYDSVVEEIEDLKEGILLEVGFDTVTPNRPVDIHSWVYNHAVTFDVPLIDNRALGIACYHPGYTLIEKLQTVSTKYRKHREKEAMPPNFMRHYYDIYCLLENSEVKSFIGSKEYHDHKAARFRSADNPIIAENEAFLLSDPDLRGEYEKAYMATQSLYYQGQVPFTKLLSRIHENVDTL